MFAQTVAIFLDAYRELHSRRLFWITMVLSGLVVAIFALVGIDETGISIAGWHFNAPFNTEVMEREAFYKWLFVDFGIGIWLTFVATILALVSTAGMVPDLISSGSVDLLLSKPIGRLRLFFTKYAAGLLFVTLQVTVFTLISLLVLGVRGGFWAPGILVAIPIVVVFFSYLFCVCALLGMITRSTIASLLLTLLFWFGIFIVHTAEVSLMTFKVMTEQGVEQKERAISRREARLKSLREGEQDETTSEKITSNEKLIEEDRDDLKSASRTVSRLRLAHNIVYGFKTVLPKTSETIGLLQRWLVDFAQLQTAAEEEQQSADEDSEMDENPFEDPQTQQKLMEAFNERSVWWIIGTSLCFEAVLLLLSGWVFCRRDF